VSGASAIEFIANGKPRRAAQGCSVADLIHELGFAPAQVVVELNGEPLERKRFATAPLRSGDRIEIAQMVGGG